MVHAGLKQQQSSKCSNITQESTFWKTLHYNIFNPLKQRYLHIKFSYKTNTQAELWLQEKVQGFSGFGMTTK